MSIPKHVAIIMDGNGRWAQARNKPRTYGHIKGTRVAKKIITACSRRGIKHLTLYAFSSENWLRPHAEVFLLMKLLRKYLHRETANLIKENIRFDVVGDLQRLPSDIVETIEYSKNSTKDCTGLRLTFALSYGSRWEITEAVKNIAQQVANGDLRPHEIDEVVVGSYLQTYPSPDPDFIIRTSGEKRISNFLLWQAAYAEFYFTDAYWPDFTEQDLDLAIANYLKRERRFGSIGITENASH